MDCFTLPSIYEGLPVVGVEAQANGLKCYFSKNVTSEAKLLEETEYITVKENPSVWAKRIEEYLSSNHLQRINKCLPDIYDIKKTSARLLNLYTSFVSDAN